MTPQELIEAIRDAGAGSDDDAVKAALEDGAVLAWFFDLGKFDPDDEDSVAGHAAAQEVAEEAYAMI